MCAVLVVIGGKSVDVKLSGTGDDRLTSGSRDEDIYVRVARACRELKWMSR